MPTVATSLANPGFESGNTGWTLSGGWVITTGFSTYSGSYSANIDTARTGHDETSDIINNNVAPVVPGKTVTVRGRCWGAGADGNVAAVLILWYDSAFNVIRTKEGNYSNWGSHKSWDLSSVTDTAPAGAAYVGAGFRGKSNVNGACAVDELSWDYVYDRTVTLTSPVDGNTYGVGESITLSVNIAGTSPATTSVTYKDGVTDIATVTTSPFTTTTNTLAAGAHSITAVVTFDDSSTIISPAVNITVAVLTPPETREYKASNAYTYLLAENFSGLSAAMPSTALVTAVEIVVDYKLKMLVRSKNIDVDVGGADPNIIFDITDGGRVEAVLLTGDDSTYTTEGSPTYGNVTIELSDFDITETGTSEEKKWTVFTSTAFSTVVGSSSDLFGIPSIAVGDFVQRQIGLRFLPNLLPKPDYADSGDACIRFQIDKVRMRVYFDAGSAIYYFASPDKTQVLEGTLVHATVENGDLTTSDASGILQLQPTLTIKDGTQTYIADDWTIHAAYPPSDENQIGVVAARSPDDGIGMSYNGLPSCVDILDNRSRYIFITSNFYGDEALTSIYGANGVGRAFAYNGDFFYTIQDHPDADKDKPRHVAYHHGHLALGYKEGRVDISVIGKPYSFDGLLGASSWALGDAVVGLLPLSGTILGAFCQNSIWGISGTTVDNFATQIISPKMGAIEYTITDMGFPVYANAYGVYTLAQTQQYGDYLGTPMSQAVSPWLRPRLIRKNTSSKEVVVAWPVRSKNQYRIAFADGYVMSMTINAGMQTAPTFSFQKYTLYTDDELGLGSGVGS